MKNDVFYRCMIFKDKCYASRTLGYTEGGIGLFKEPIGWVATHVPTGTRITPRSSRHNTAKQALLEAEHIIAKTDYMIILNAIKKIRNMKKYNDFIVDRNKQRLISESMKIMERKNE